MSNIRYNFMLRRLATMLAVTALTLSLVAAVTGVLIAFYYGPNAGGANDEIKYMVNQVPSGWLIYSLHNTAGNGLIAVCLCQIVVMFYRFDFDCDRTRLECNELGMDTTRLLAFQA